MSTESELYVGYTVNLKTDLTSEDFSQLDEFLEANPEYNRFDCVGHVSLIVDGMCGDFARLIYVEHHVRELYSCPYLKLSKTDIPDDVYAKLNIAYTKLYGKELDRECIDYSAWVHCT